MKHSTKSMLSYIGAGLLLLTVYLVVRYNSFDARLHRSLQSNGVSMHALNAAIVDSDSTESIVKTLWIWLTDEGKSAPQRSLAANSLHLLTIGEWKLPNSSTVKPDDFETVFENWLSENERKNSDQMYVAFFRKLKSDNRNRSR